jgi:glycosyltransferase involved in cell wall biosynthesis
MAKNVLFIPTWYPIEKDSFAGVFCRDQVKAFAAHLPEYNFFVTLWGQDILNYNLKKPLSYLKANTKFKTLPKPHIEKLSDNLFHVHRYKKYANLKIGGVGTIKKTIMKMVEDIEKSYGKIDLIHSHVSFPGGYIANLISKELNIPYIVQEHMGPFPFEHLIKNGSLIPQMQKAIDDADLVLAVSESLKKRMAEFSKNNIQVLHNLVNENDFQIQGPDSPNTNDTPFTFFTLAGMYPKKGIDKLLHGIKTIKEQNFKHIIAGKGEYFEKYRDLSKQLGLENIVEWVDNPNFEEKLKLYQKSDAFILTSHYETFGVVYTEAMACGKPVIGYRSGGPETIITPEVGLLTDTLEAEEIGNKMLTLMNNIQDYDAKQIRQNFLNRFSMDVISKQAQQFYHSIQSK